MEIKKYYQNNGQLKKDILTNNHFNIYDITLKVHCYTSIDDNDVITDLEVDLYSKDNDYIKSFTVSSIITLNSFGNFCGILKNHRKALLSEKNKVFKYLKGHFENTLYSQDYCQ